MELFALTLATVSCIAELAAASIRLYVVLANVPLTGIPSCRTLCPHKWGWCFDKVYVRIHFLFQIASKQNNVVYLQCELSILIRHQQGLISYYTEKSVSER